MQDGDTICLVTDDTLNNQLAQAIVYDGKFLFSGEVDTVRLCRAYVKKNPKYYTTLFLEPGNITVELSSTPYLCRVSGTRQNNDWQQLTDSINLLMQDINRIMCISATNDSIQTARAHTIDSLHKKMSDCILHTGQRNSGHPLGKYIEENYKAPEFK